MIQLRCNELKNDPVGLKTFANTLGLVFEQYHKLMIDCLEFCDHCKTAITKPLLQVGTVQQGNYATAFRSTEETSMGMSTSLVPDFLDPTPGSSSKEKSASGKTSKDKLAGSPVLKKRKKQKGSQDKSDVNVSIVSDQSIVSPKEGEFALSLAPTSRSDKKATSRLVSKENALTLSNVSETSLITKTGLQKMKLKSSECSRNVIRVNQDEWIFVPKGSSRSCMDDSGPKKLKQTKLTNLVKVSPDASLFKADFDFDVKKQVAVPVPGPETADHDVSLDAEVIESSPKIGGRKTLSRKKLKRRQLLTGDLDKENLKKKQPEVDAGAGKEMNLIFCEEFLPPLFSSTQKETVADDDANILVISPDIQEPEETNAGSLDGFASKCETEMGTGVGSGTECRAGTGAAAGIRADVTAGVSAGTGATATVIVGVGVGVGVGAAAGAGAEETIDDETFFAPPEVKTSKNSTNYLKGVEEAFQHSFDVLPSKREPEVPANRRCKAERAKMDGHDCWACNEYYNDFEYSEERRKAHQKYCSRHRGDGDVLKRSRRQSQEFWNPLFPASLSSTFAAD